MIDYLIKNGLIINGNDEKGFIADIAISNDNIIKIGQIQEKANHVIDAEGCIVIPGFIEIHCHSDAIIFTENKNYRRLWQGVTTELIGNCGISPSPVNLQFVEDLRKYNAPFYSNIPMEYEKYQHFGDYLDAVEQAGPVLNTAALVGHGALRVAVAGFDTGCIRDDKLEAMQQLLQESIKEGAYGLSTGLIYPPGIYADEYEIETLVGVVKENDGLYATHMRSESGNLVQSVEEVLQLVRRTGVNMEISHHKAMGIDNFGKLKTTVPMIERAIKEGFRVNMDTYPYTACSTQLSAILPPWTFAGGVGALHERLGNKEERRRMINDIKEKPMSYENYYQLAGWDRILVNECSVPTYVGKTISEIAIETGRDPFEAALDVLYESNNEAMMICFCISEEDIITSYQSDASMVCTDGFPAIGKSHPRYVGSFLRVLEKYVRTEGILSLPRAVYKMTGMPADKIGIFDRGRLKRVTKPIL